MRLASLLTVLCLVASLDAGGEIYTWTDNQGHTHFGDRPPAGAAVQTLDPRVNSIGGPASDPGNPSRPRVLLYSAEWCGVCRKAKRYFKEREVPYQEYDVEKSAKGRRDYARLRGSGVPIILVGERRMDGFTQERFERLYLSP